MTTRVQRASLLVLVTAVCFDALHGLASPQAATAPTTVAAAAAQLPAPPPLPKSPVDGFRELLAMKPAEREQYFTNRPPQIREPLEAKIREYEALTPEVREARLRATQLHWYLTRAIPAPSSNATVDLKAVPEAYRIFASNRVSQFKLLPPPLQQDVLAHPTTAGYFFGRPATNALGPIPPPPAMPRPLATIGKLSVEQREKLFSSFERFLEMPPAQRSAVLARLAPGDRAQVQKVLLVLEGLPADQRERGLSSIGLVVTMNEDQRRQLLNNAARWKELPPAERQVWTNLVRRLPPLPPGAGVPGFPPLPGALATNPAN